MRSGNHCIPFFKYYPVRHHFFGKLGFYILYSGKFLFQLVLLQSVILLEVSYTCSPRRLHQKRMYLQQQSQGMGLQTYFNQMQIDEGSYPTGSPPLDPAASQSSPQGSPMSATHQPQAQQQGSPQASPPFSHAHNLSPVMEPGEALGYDAYMTHHHYTQHLPPGSHLHHQFHHPQPHEAAASSLGFSYPGGCEQQVLGPSTEALLPEQYEFALDPSCLPPPAGGEVNTGAMGGVLAASGQSDGLGLPELQGSLLDSEMMETVDSQHGFVLVN